MLAHAAMHFFAGTPPWRQLQLTTCPIPPCTSGGPPVYEWRIWVLATRKGLEWGVLQGRRVDFDLTLRLHVRRPPSLGRRQCETKASASGAKLCKIITQLHPQRRILGKVIPLAPLLKSRVCHKFASPIMAWVPPSSCTSRIPKQHSLDPPVQGQIRNMHRKFPVMFEALFRPSVQSCCCASASGFSFQSCRISCQGAFHSTKLDGPTIIRSILR